ncbi:hypothetical protein CI109_107046 [Kwoniella shandongensis]|uniref:Uncharacterized protein n=1 Tax=Kwoniella shandongensis TaxID=1734106 RepID=A0A5M6BUD7_9TREE|nr:uncharacterized protein CI109_006454 [Kwoniella shandongensis]KAA5525185.1 hypothetical protein CI109_006454 [Kwoniella shandongensis]
MSIDLSDPQLTAVRGAIADPNDQTSWFILHYATPSTASPAAHTPSLALVSSGPDPVLPQWQEHLNGTNEDVLFGYGDIGGKGLVLVFLRDTVGGVKRARAIVHSRAVANLFPDYSALVTIAHPSQLTEDLVTERLGLDHSSAPTPIPKYTVPGSDIPDPLSPTAAGQGRDIPRSVSQSNGQSHADTARNVESTSSPLRQHHQQSHIDSPQRTSSPGPNLAGPISLDSPTRPEFKSQGISSTDYFKDDNARSRKPSFGARLKHTFTHRSTPSIDDNSGQASSSSPAATYVQSQTNSPQPGSPTSPGTSRFKASSLVKALGGKRRVSENVIGGTTPANGSPPTSPQVNEFGQGGYGGNGDLDYAPPVPPKDETFGSQRHQPVSVSTDRFPDQDRNESNPTSPSRAGTNGHGNGFMPQDETSHVQEQQQNLVIPPTSRSSSLSPSPSARHALYTARQKSLTQETEIQERFRRDQEEKMRRGELGSRGNLVADEETRDVNLNDDDDDDDGSVRLAYDESDPEDDHEHHNGGNGIVLGGVVDFNKGTPIDGDKQQDLLEPPQRGSSLPSSGGTPVDHSQAISDDVPTATETVATHDQLEEEQARQHAAEQARLREHAEVEAAARAREEEARRAAEQERLEEERMWEEKRLAEEKRMEEERVRLEQLKLEEEADAARRAEEERLELERLRVVEEERLRQEEEKARFEAEERARLEAEERERSAVEEEERKRLEAEEQERLRIENEKRIQWEKEEHERLVREEEQRQKEEQERVRKNSIREGLEKGRKDGGVMLRGWATVQTYKSMTWRRRYFHLLSTEMRLFKTEGDAKPIQTIYFGSKSSVSETYEESQVKDSFKVISDGPKGEEEFFLFTDSAEDKETVLQGLRMCLQ